MVGAMWECFHRCWGNAASGTYDKKTWMKLQECLYLLLKLAGIERRTRVRVFPLDPDDK